MAKPEVGQQVLLLVEDEVLVAMAEAETLRSFGFEVLLAATGEEAVEIAGKTSTLDLVLLDIDLGRGIDGAEAARRILAIRKVPVMFLTSHAERVFVERVAGVPNFGYVLKSSGGFVLGSSIEAALEAFRNIEEYRSAFRTSPDMITITSLDGTYIDVNEGFSRVFGYPREEVLGKRAEQLRIWVDKEGWDGYVRSLMTKHAVEDFDADFRTKDGSILNCSISAVLFRYRSDTHILAVIRDVSERKRNENALVANQSLFSELGRLAKIGAWRADIETGKVEWTEGLYSLFEKDASFPLTVENILTLYVPESREALSRAIRKTTEEGERFDLEAEIITGKGNRRSVHIVGKAGFRDGRIAYRTGVVQDITELKRVTDALARTNRLMTTILDSSPDVIVFALDKSYRYLAFNTKHEQTMRQIWGREIKAGMSILEVVGNDGDRAAAKANFDRALRGETFTLVEEYGDEKLSRLVWLDYYSPLLDSAGNPIGLTCFVLNHTEQRQAENKVVRLLEEKEIILREVHHRIKNNMSTMMSLLSIQAMKLQDPVAIEALENAHNLMRSMGVLYDRLYKSDNLIDLSVKDYFPPLIDDILRILPTTTVIRTAIHLEDFVLEVKDLSALGIIINEVVTNAVKYAFPGRTEGLITVSASKEGNRVRILIGDDGLGLPSSIDVERSEGFGLILVKLLSQQLQAALKVERENGTRFILEFQR